VKRFVATVVLVAVYRLSAAFSWLLGGPTTKAIAPRGKILVIGTFHNPNWFHAHVTPLAKTGSEVILVCDEVVDDVDGVRYACPPRWMSAVLSRAVAKFLVGLYHGIRSRPDLYMGYHIFPAAISCLIIARIMRRPACYQITSGPLELEGGGWHAENPLLVALGRPSESVEKAVFAAVRQFDVAIVRGRKAAAFVRAFGYEGQLAIITGSVATPAAPQPLDKRNIDLIFVGRLAEYKRPDRFLNVVAGVAKTHPTLRVLAVGDGPDREALEQQATSLDLDDVLEFAGQRTDVPDLLASAKLYVLTSRWEGLSIALLEAMSNGAVPVVSDVGDLCDVVIPDETGYIFDGDDIEHFVSAIAGLLDDQDRWQRMSTAARKKALDLSSRDSVAEKWRSVFAAALNPAHAGRDV